MKLLLLNEEMKPAWIDIADILIANSAKKGPQFVAESGVYRFPFTSAELRQMLGRFGFEQADRGSLINMNRAAEFDPERRIVYFDSTGPEEGADRLYATVSWPNAHKLKHLIRESGGGKELYEAGPRAVAGMKRRRCRVRRRRQPTSGNR